MFEQPQSVSSSGNVSSYFELSSSSSSSSGGGVGGSMPINGSAPTAHPTSVIVPPRGSSHRADQTPLTPSTPYYSNGYGFPLFLGTDFLQFPPGDVTSPLTPNISSPLTPSPFGPFPGSQLYARPPAGFSDFYATAAAVSSPMVQYSTGKKSSAGRKPKEEDNMEDDDDDKKLKRRQRNKEAAARCRQRRLDLMKELQDQVNGFKHVNDKKTAECNEMRKELNTLKSYFETHDCKLSVEERMSMTMTIPPVPQPPVHLHHQLRVHPPRAESVAHSVMSNHSSSSSEQHSPVEDYKPSIDQLLLPPISSIANKNDRLINSMPPPMLPQSTSSAGIHIVTSIPIPNSSAHSGPSHSMARSENVFAEPELKIPKMEGMDRTLASLAPPDDLERPSMLPMLSRNPINHPITTPSRIFRSAYNGEYHQTPQSNPFGLGPDVHGDFLATNTGLTPSTQPTLAFVSTPTPLAQISESDLRPL